MQQSRFISAEKLWTKDFLLISLANFLIFLGFQMLGPTLPVYVKDLGASDFQVGMVVSLFSLAALLLRPIAGIALDTFGRKPIITLGLCSLILFNAAYYWISAVGLILALRFVHGIGWGVTSTANATIVSDIVPAARRGEGLGYYSLSMNVATAFSPLAGIWIVNEYGFHTMIIISTLLIATALPASQWIYFVKGNRQDKSARFTIGWHDLIEPRALFPSLLCFFTSVSFSGIMSYIMLFGQEAGIGNVGWFFLVNAAMIVLTRPFVGKWFDRKGPTVVFLPGAVFLLAGLILLSFAHNTTTLIGSAVCYGIGYGAVQPSLQAWAVNRADANRKGAANGTFLSAIDIGFAFGAMILGAIAENTSYAAMYRFSALSVILFLAIYVAYLARGKWMAPYIRKGSSKKRAMNS